MDADQRLLALKKAYADVILNISKEAAARVMASERKSQLLMYELQATKEDAVRTMLRLKKMMDDKISETKRTSRNQQEKIDELEAQLQEAEDIVSELREELRHGQAKIERVTRNDVQHLDKHENATSEISFEKNRQYISQSVSCPLQSQKISPVHSEKEKSYLNQWTEYPKCPSQLIQMRNFYGTKPELPSIILRSKKHNFYRNGFTQRIHACERNVLDGELSLSKQPDGLSSKGKEGEKADKSTCKATTDGVDQMFNIKNKEAMHKDGSMNCCWSGVQAVNLISEKVKTTPMYKKHTSASRQKSPDKLFMKVYKTPGDPNPESVKNNAQPDWDPTLTAPKLSSDKAGMATQPECAKTAEMNGDNDKGASRVDILVPIVQKGIYTENSDIQVSEPNLKKINDPVLHSELKTSNATSECPSLPVDKKVIKCTFQRKRKRETVSISDGYVSSENNTLVRKKEKPTEYAAAEKSSLEAKSSLEKRL